MIDKYHSDGNGHYNQLGYIQDTTRLTVVKPKMSTKAIIESIMFYSVIALVVLGLICVII